MGSAFLKRSVAISLKGHFVHLQRFEFSEHLRNLMLGTDELAQNVAEANASSSYTKTAFSLAVCTTHDVLYVLLDVFATVADSWGRYREPRHATVTRTVACSGHMGNVIGNLEAAVTKLECGIRESDTAPIIKGPIRQM